MHGEWVIDEASGNQITSPLMISPKPYPLPPLSLSFSPQLRPEKVLQNIWEDWEVTYNKRLWFNSKFWNQSIDHRWWQSTIDGYVATIDGQWQHCWSEPLWTFASSVVITPLMVHWESSMVNLEPSMVQVLKSAFELISAVIGSFLFRICIHMY